MLMNGGPLMTGSKKKYHKSEYKEKGSVASEKAEGASKIKQELRSGTEKHVGAAKKALKQLKKGK